MGILSLERYKSIVRDIPILTVDGLIVNGKGEYLIVKRKNEPLKGQWWRPGGRVWKGEKLKDAFTRKMKEELGTDVKIIHNAGYYEDFYSKSPYGIPIHTVSIVFLAVISGEIKLDNQSKDYKWSVELPKSLKIIK